MVDMELKHITQPDEKRTLPKTKIEVIDLGGTTIMRATFEPGWRWSECVKPTVGTKSCEVQHINFVISGKIKIMMDNGTVKTMVAGDVAHIPPGHDAMVVGDEPCVVLDFTGGDIFGKKLR